ncbi:helix-turn-helix domain-containing protein [Streptomyces sp. NPDC056352]|uniref:helix-turn-helix domain-containing protein n=1 Tax=Streptomyces sp. NPDC056352 TaxID=3345791 RepID=UPI0035E2D834
MPFPVACPWLSWEPRIRAERRARGMAVERLVGLSGVSRSMVSEAERSTKTPSVLVLDRLATAPGTSIARLPGRTRAPWCRCPAPRQAARSTGSVRVGTADPVPRPAGRRV